MKINQSHKIMPQIKVAGSITEKKKKSTLGGLKLPESRVSIKIIQKLINKTIMPINSLFNVI